MAKPYSKAEVATHNTPDDLWIIISGEVYNLTEFQHEHPGGQKILKVVSGKDATKPFKKNHNERILKTWRYEKLCIGTLAAEEEKVEEKKRGFFGWGKRKEGAAKAVVREVVGLKGKEGEVNEVKVLKKMDVGELERKGEGVSMSKIVTGNVGLKGL